MSPRGIRESAGETQARTAYHAGVSEPLVRLYEANPEAVKSAAKKAALDAVYERMANAGHTAEVRAAG